MSSAPARVDKFPVAIVYLDSVPSMPRRISRWRGLTVLDGSKTKAFAMASNNHALQPCAFGNGLEYARVSLANRFARENGVTGGSSGRTARKEALDIIIDVVVTPCENRPSLVCWRGEGTAEIVSQETNRITAIDDRRRILSGDTVWP